MVAIGRCSATMAGMAEAVATASECSAVSRLQPISEFERCSPSFFESSQDIKFFKASSNFIRRDRSRGLTDLDPFVDAVGDVQPGLDDRELGDTCHRLELELGVGPPPDDARTSHVSSLQPAFEDPLDRAVGGQALCMGAVLFSVLFRRSTPALGLAGAAAAAPVTRRRVDLLPLLR